MRLWVPVLLVVFAMGGGVVAADTFPAPNGVVIEPLILNKMCPPTVNEVMGGGWGVHGIHFESMLKSQANDPKTWSYVENNKSIEFEIEGLRWNDMTVIKNSADPSIGTFDNESSLIYPNALGTGIDIKIIQDNYRWQKIVEIESLASLGTIPVGVEYLEISFNISGDFVFPDGVINDCIPFGENSFIQPVRAWDSSLSSRDSIDHAKIGVYGVITENRITKHIPVAWLKTAKYPVQTDITITYGAENVFNAGDTQDISVSALDSTHFVVAYRDAGNSDYGTAIVGLVSGTTISSYGAENVFNSAITYDISVSALDSTHFVVAYRMGGAGGFGTALVGLVSGTTISSYGAKNVFNTGFSPDISVSALDSTHFVVAYRDAGNSDYGTAIVGLVSGTTISSYGAENVFNSHITNHVSVSALDPTHFVVAYYISDCESAGSVAIVGLVSGTTISSYGAANMFKSDEAYDISVSALDSTHFVVAYRISGEASSGIAIVGLVSGTTISSYGAENAFIVGSSNYISVSALDSSHFVVAYQAGGEASSGTAIVGLVSGTTISSYGAETVFTTGDACDISVSALDSSHFVVAYRDGSNLDYGIAIVGGVAADTWQSDPGIVSGLVSVDAHAFPTVFQKDGTWYLIAGVDYGDFDGYNWTGSTWQSDSGIVGGLGSLAYYSSPTVFEKDSTWYLISGENSGVFYGYNWTGSTWQSDSGIVGGLNDVGMFSAPMVFQKDSTWYLISGEEYGTFDGYNWTGSTWQSDSGIVGGLNDVGDYSTPNAFEVGGVWYFIAGERYGGFDGYNWTGSTWQSDTDIISGLDDVGDYSTTTVFQKGGLWYLIAGEGGESGGAFNGYNHTDLSTPVPSGLTHIKNKFWVNHTWEAGSGATTDSYNVSINGTWHNSTLTTYYNNTLTTYGDWSNVTVYAFNNIHGLSGGSVSEDVQLPYLIPAVPEGAGSTWNYYWVNHVWTEGSSYGIWCGDTDSYNYSVTTRLLGSSPTTVWYNDSTNTSHTNSLGMYGWSNITVYALNDTGGINETYIYQNVQVPMPSNPSQCESDCVGTKHTCDDDCETAWNDCYWTCDSNWYTCRDDCDMTYNDCMGDCDTNHWACRDGCDMTYDGCMGDCDMNYWSCRDGCDMNYDSCCSDCDMMYTPGTPEHDECMMMCEDERWMCYDGCDTTKNDCEMQCENDKMMCYDGCDDDKNSCESSCEGTRTSCYSTCDSDKTSCESLCNDAKPGCLTDCSDACIACLASCSLVPDPTDLTHTKGMFWVNHTWNIPPGGDVVDSYNVSINQTWHNSTTDRFYNNTGLSMAGQWSNVTVWSFNNTNGLSDESASEDVQLPMPIPAVPAGAGSTWDFYWVNHTWTEGSSYGLWCGDTDSYNYSVTTHLLGGSPSTVWYNDSTNTSHNNSLGTHGWSNITVYAFNDTGGINETSIYQNVQVLKYIPPDPTNLQNTSGYYWVNHTWDAGSGGYATDMYNVSIEGKGWYNDTYTTWWNDSLGAPGWSNITVYAFNTTGGLSSGSGSEDVQLRAPVPATPADTGSTWDFYWVNHTWTEGSSYGIWCGDTDSYNYSVTTHLLGGSPSTVWYNDSTNTSHNNSLGDFGWSNITVYAWNYTGGINETAIHQNVQLPAPVPATPADTGSTWDCYWVNHTWTEGSSYGIWCGDTDSYNYSVTTHLLGGSPSTVWYNDSTNTSHRNSLGTYGWSNITVYAWNNTGGINETAIHQNVHVMVEWVDNWQPYNAIAGGLGDVGYQSTPTVFQMDGTWYLIAGELFGDFYGFRWTGSAWQSYSAIVDGLNTDWIALSPNVFQMDGTWYLISGASNGNFLGFRWTGSTWQTYGGIVGGLGDVGGFSTSTVFQKDETWYLIAGDGDGTFTGYNWTGTVWQSDGGIVSGLGNIWGVSAPTVFQKDRIWYLIAGRGYGNFKGFRWAGSAWQSDDGVVGGLGNVGGNAAPIVFRMDRARTWYLISGAYGGSFHGFKQPLSVASVTITDWWNSESGDTSLNVDVDVGDIVSFSCTANDTASEWVWSSNIGSSSHTLNSTTTHATRAFNDPCGNVEVSVVGMDNRDRLTTTTIWTVFVCNMTPLWRASHNWDVEDATGTCHYQSSIPAPKTYSYGIIYYSGEMSVLESDCYLASYDSGFSWNGACNCRNNPDPYGYCNDRMGFCPIFWCGGWYYNCARFVIYQARGVVFVTNIDRFAASSSGNAHPQGWTRWMSRGEMSIRTWDCDCGFYTVSGTVECVENVTMYEDYDGSTYYLTTIDTNNISDTYSFDTWKEGEFILEFTTKYGGVEHITFTCTDNHITNYNACEDFDANVVVFQDISGNLIRNIDVSVYDLTDNVYVHKWETDEDGIIDFWIGYYGGHTMLIAANTFAGVFTQEVYFDPGGDLTNITLPLRYNVDIHPEDEHGIPLTEVFCGLSEYTPLNPQAFWGCSMGGRQYVPITNCSGFAMCDIYAEKGGYADYEVTALNWTSKTAMVKDYRHTAVLEAE